MCIKIGMADLNCIVELSIQAMTSKQLSKTKLIWASRVTKCIRSNICTYIDTFVLMLHIPILQLLHVIYFIQIIYIKILREKIKGYSKFIHETWVINLSNSKCLNFPWMYINQALQWISKAIYIIIILLLWSQINIYFILEGAAFFIYSYFCFLLFFYKYIAISNKLKLTRNTGPKKKNGTYPLSPKVL